MRFNKVIEKIKKLSRNFGAKNTMTELKNLTGASKSN